MSHQCGSCTACCSTVAVKELNLLPWHRCGHLRDPWHKDGPGCGIYADRPYSCRSWRCVWLQDDTWPDDYRPDRLGAVVDENHDLIEIDGRKVKAVQIWAMAGREVTKDPRLYRIIESILRQNVAPAVLLRLPPGTEALAFFLKNGKIQYCRSKLDEGEKRLGDQSARLNWLFALERAGK
jgi:hypothetical protein